MKATIFIPSPHDRCPACGTAFCGYFLASKYVNDHQNSLLEKSASDDGLNEQNKGEYMNILTTSMHGKGKK